jgi:hypothetical protein
MNYLRCVFLKLLFIKIIYHEKIYFSQNNTAAILGLLIVIVVGCSKVELHDETANEPQYQTMTAEDISVMNKIVAFREKLAYHRDNPDFKSGEVMSAEEAVWNLETLFNVTYGFPDEQYGRTKSDTTVLYIDINSNGDVLLDDVVALYSNIITLVTQYYYNSGYDQKGFLLLHLTQRDFVNGQMEIGLRAVTGEKSEWEPFGPLDQWWFGYYKGDCNWDSSGTDAAQKIQYAINYNKPLVSPPPGYRFVYSPNDTIPVFGHEYTNDVGEHLIFYIENPMGTFTWAEKCLDPDEMNYHFFGQQEVIYNILPVELNKPANWTFMDCLIEGKQGTNPDENDIPCIHHYNTLTYALRYLVPVFIIEPPIDL